MNKLLKVLLCCAVFFLMRCHPNIDFKETQQVSKSIEEAQKRKTFVAEYVIEGVKNYGDSEAFPIEKAWAEKVWYLTLDSNGKQTVRVDTAKSNVVFLLKPNGEVNEKNYLKKWIIWSKDSSSTALLNDRVSLQPNNGTAPDSVFLAAYILGSSYNYKENLKPIASFIAVRR